MRTVIVGTAGHIDHGKSELVKALTGTHPDRLREERERGITIDLGFASRTEDDLVLSFVDVPGHERFIKNMLAGASGIDLVLLAVAADESVRPQTREHFHICRLLGLERGVIVLTKIDLADQDLIEVAAEEIREFVRGSFLESASLVRVSARTGEGLTELVAALRSAAASLEPRPETGSARLPVDRSFTVRGFGTVVTGTLAAGTIRVGDEMDVLTGTRRVKVRGIEAQGRPVPIVVAGQRVALNLQGISHHEIARGDVLAEPGAFIPTSIFDARVSVLEDAPAPLRDLARVRLHAGTAEILARVRPLSAAELPPGGEGYAQFRLERPSVLVPGDRFILRRYSPSSTIGGGVVLDAGPEKRRKADPRAELELRSLEDPSPGRRAEWIVASRGPRGIAPADLARRAGASWDVVRLGLAEPLASGKIVLPGSVADIVISREGFDSIRATARSLLAEFHARQPLQPGLKLEELRSRLSPGASAEGTRAILAELEARGELRIERDVAALPDHSVSLSQEQGNLARTLGEMFERGGLAPPEPAEALVQAGAPGLRGEAVLAHLIREGTLRRLRDGRLFHRESLAGLRAKLLEYRRTSATIDVARFKELTGVSRKHAIPLLEYLDEERVTLRKGNDRVILT